MKVTVTALKAPWAAGTAVGSVVEFDGDAIPPCFAGKCAPVEGGEAAADHRYVPNPIVDGAPLALPADPDELKAVEALLSEARLEADELRSRVERAEAALAAKGTELEASQAELVAALQRATDAEAALAAKSKKG